MSMEISGNYKDYKNELHKSRGRKIKVKGFQFQRTSISAVKNPAASPVVCIV